MRTRLGRFIAGYWQLASALYLIQALNLGVPIVLVPFLTRMLGVEAYGQVAFALTVLMFAQGLVNYGFEYLGARLIAQQPDTARQATLYSTVLVLKAALTVLACLAVVSVAALQDSKSSISTTGVVALGVVATGLTQTWLFLGRGEMLVPAVVTLAARTGLLVSTFAFINDGDSAVRYTVLYCSSLLLVGLAETAYISRRIGLPLSLPGWTLVRDLAVEGLPVFLSNLLMVVMTTAGVFFLELKSTSDQVGGYFAVSRIIGVVLVAYTPLGNLMFPLFARRFSSYGGGDLVPLGLSAVVVGIAGSVSALSMGLVAGPSIRVLLGPEFVPFSGLVIPLALMAFWSIANNLIGVQGLLARGESLIFASGLVITVMIFVPAGLIGAELTGAVGVAWAAAVSELVLFACLAVGCIAVSRRDPVTSQKPKMDN